MTFKDLILTPVYLIIIYFFAFVIKQKIKNPVLKQYFIPALTVKIIGAIALGLIYQFYYPGGDTYNYFTFGSNRIFEAFLVSPWDGVRLIFVETNNVDEDLLQYTSNMYWLNDAACYFVIRVSAVLGLLTYNTYTVNAMFFAIIGLSGLWAMFITVYGLYPNLHKELAISIFFIPSVFFWGSGLLKDTLTISAVGWFVYSFYRVLILRKFSLTTLGILITSILVLKIVKIYILICIIPSVFIWLFFHYNSQIRSKTTRALLKPIMIIGSVAMGMVAANEISKDNEKYSFENLTKTAVVTSNYLLYMSNLEGGSGYSLGDFEPTPTGMLKIAPSAIWVTLFRPYIFEAKNVVMMISALESTFFLVFTLLAIYRAGPINTFSIIKKNPFVFFSLVFSLTFAFAVGLSTSNFGSLVRYKIPIMPFYLASIYILFHFRKVKKTGKVSTIQGTLRAEKIG